MSTLAAAAVAYAVAGYEVFPLRGKLPFGNCPQCEPRSPRYRPHQAAECEHELCHGLYAATRDPDRVARWWARWPQANIGARVPRSLLVVDVGPRHGGQARLTELEREHGPLPPTRISVSGRGDGGRHCWFLHPGGRLSAVRLGAAWTSRATPAMCCCPQAATPPPAAPTAGSTPTWTPHRYPAGWRACSPHQPPPRRRLAAGPGT
jgi:hypothetical protein